MQRMILLMLATCGVLAAQEFAGREKLRAHSDEFRKDAIKVTDGVYAAIGFSDANLVLIQGDGGSIIVDTTSDVTDASAVKAEFAKLSAAPVRAIIYTHSHPDHTGGATVFAGNDHPEISTEGDGVDGTRRAADQRHRAQLLPLCRPVSAARVTRPLRRLAILAWGFRSRPLHVMLVLATGPQSA